MPRRKRNTIAAHPGAILRTEFMEPMGITAYQLATAIHPPGIYEIVRGQRGISADVALRMGKYFGMTPEFWMNRNVGKPCPERCSRSRSPDCQ